jgi:DNA invertase Pin-like site-specific DNA recombinase
MPVYGYKRVSTEEQVDGTSLAEQHRVITGNAMVAGIEIDQWIEDGGTSGMVPFFERLAAHGVEVKPGDTLIVSKLDRFSRDLRDALNTIHECKRQGIRLIVDGHGDVTDDSNLVARLMLEIMLAFSGHERRVTKERQRLGQRAKRAQNGHIGGSAPFGYQVVGRGKAARLEPVKEQQEALATIMAMHKEGASSRRIAQAVVERHGVRISHAGVCRVIERGV